MGGWGGGGGYWGVINSADAGLAQQLTFTTIYVKNKTKA